MCLGADSASKSEYQDIPGGKGGRCVRLTTYHLHVPIAKKCEGLNLLKPCRPVQACNGTALPFILKPNSVRMLSSYRAETHTHIMKTKLDCVPLTFRVSKT